MFSCFLHCQPAQAWAADPDGWDSAKIRKSKEFVKETVSRDRTHFKTEHMLKKLLGKADARAYMAAHQEEATKDDIGILWYPFAETVIDQNNKCLERKQFQKVGDVSDSKGILKTGPAILTKGPIVEEVESDEDASNDEDEDEEDAEEDDEEDDSEQDEGAAPMAVEDKLPPAKALKDMTTFLEESVLKPKLLPKDVRQQLKKLLEHLARTSGQK